MAAMLETPSRIWRRIQDAEVAGDMPSLPSLPAFDDTASDDDEQEQEQSLHILRNESFPVQSTPPVSSSYAATARAPSSTSSTARFAASLSTRSGIGSSTVRSGVSSSRMSISRKNQEESFDISEIPSVPVDEALDDADMELELNQSRETVPDAHLAPENEYEDENILLTDALESVSRSSSPLPAALAEGEPTPRKQYDYSVSLRSEPKPSPYNTLKNVSVRKTAARSRTPSLSHTTPSPTSSSSNSTPHSARSVPLPSSPIPALVLSHADEDEASEEYLLSQIAEEDELEEEGGNPDIITEGTASEHDAEDGTEGTFSSEEAPTHINSNIGRSPIPLSSAFSSPAASAVNTPTPAYQGYTQLPRPIYQLDDPATPAFRRASFLLSVVNSTTRPRLALQPTPHPHGRTTASTANVITSFAGATPARLHPRFSGHHPLAQSFTPSTPSSPSLSPNEHNPNASFISTASSHDLTAQAGRGANASFDPAVMRTTGMVGRFNAGKLNAYLHGLNRRLQEENEALVERLTAIEGQGQGPKSGRRRSSLGLGAATLQGVAEDVGAEEWMEERKALEELIEELKADVDGERAEKDAVEKVLEEERGGRARDNERWKERLEEFHQGAEGLMTGEMEEKARRAEERATRLEQERDEMQLRAEKAERVLESGQELGGALREANERIASLMGDLKNANGQIKGLEEEVMAADARVDELEKALKEEKELGEQVSKDLEIALEQLCSLEKEKATVIEELQHSIASVQELEEDAEAAVERLANVEHQLTIAHERVETLTEDAQRWKEQAERSEQDADRAKDVARRLEATMTETTHRMTDALQEAADLKSELASLERQYDREKSKSVLPSNRTELQVDVDALEEELDGAHKEIARLQTLLEQSPTRKALDAAKDLRVDMLEREKEELLERVRILKATHADSSKLLNTSGMSPMHRHVLSMRAPKTPGGPLRDMSWLNTPGGPAVSPLLEEIGRLQQELDIANESIDNKLDRLEEAGLGVIGLTRKLEDARARIGSLEEEVARLGRREERCMKRLERVRCTKCLTKIDLRRLNGTTEGDESFLALSESTLPSNPPTPPSRTTKALTVQLQHLNSQLASLKMEWKKDNQRLLDENAVLQNAAKRLNAEVRTAKHEVKRISESARAQTEVQRELEKARTTAAELEEELKAERAKLRSLTTDQDRVVREKKDVLVQLQRTESDIDDVKMQLQKAKKHNQELEEELRINTNLEQKARLLEAKVVQNQDTIDRLREERSLLTVEHKELQSLYSKVTEQANHLREKHSTLQAAHDNRRHQLDLQITELEDLRTTLTEHKTQLQRTEAERTDVVKTVASLEADLARVRRDAEAFGRDLKHLRTEKDHLEAQHRDEVSKAERAKKQAQTQLRLLKEQLERHSENARKAEEALNAHHCAADDRALASLRLQHNKECKGLIVQIRYLKAKFTRESSLRTDLGYQKQYLLILLAKFEKSEKRIVASIARIGFPVSAQLPLRPPRRSLKSIALSLVFTSRARRASDAWREQSASKDAVAAALQEVRRRRTTGT